LKQEQGEHRLDAAFWRATIVMGVISALGMWGVVVFPIDRFLPEATGISVKIDWLFKFMSFFSVPILVYVNGYILYFIIRYRNRRGQPMEEPGSSVHDHPALEFWWTAIPAVLMLVLGVLSYLLIPQYYTAKAATTNSITIEAIGHQFSWEFRYPGLHDPVPDELHLPVNVPVTIDVTSTDERDSSTKGSTKSLGMLAQTFGKPAISTALHGARTLWGRLFSRTWENMLPEQTSAGRASGGTGGWKPT